VQLSYVLPIRSATPRTDLEPYLREVASWPGVELIVVDGSEPEVFGSHAAIFTHPIRHGPVSRDRVTRMGKVGGVMTGVHLASHDHVVIADDDVVYSREQLAHLDRLLDDADVVRPQNWFHPLPWHARWDTGRILLNRVTGGDWPGTLGVRRSTLLRAGGYAGDVLFENLELVRTVEAVGGRAVLALDLLVRREPPPTPQFLDQRVRQAYDELARPWRMGVFLSIVPAAVVTRGRVVPPLAALTVVLGELGRRRAGGTEVFPPSSALWSPVWLAERSVTSWLALWALLRHGGIRYRDGVLRRAATPRNELRQRVAAAAIRPAAS
jgi:hypothetical protein